MTKNDFLNCFQLYHLSSSCHKYRHPKKLKKAAVLIAIVETTSKSGVQQLQIVFTKRAKHLRHHAGQVSFPGGKTEPFDKDLIATAIRETQEEIGLTIQTKNIIGQLHPYHTISGYLVTPIIAFISDNQEYKIDANEVDEVFQVPLNHFLNSNNHYALSLPIRGKKHQVHFMPYQAYNIWGATAAMLKDLIAHIKVC